MSKSSLQVPTASATIPSINFAQMASIAVARYEVEANYAAAKAASIIANAAHSGASKAYIAAFNAGFNSTTEGGFTPKPAPVATEAEVGPYAIATSANAAALIVNAAAEAARKLGGTAHIAAAAAAAATCIANAYDDVVSVKTYNAAFKAADKLCTAYKAAAEADLSSYKAAGSAYPDYNAVEFNTDVLAVFVAECEANAAIEAYKAAVEANNVAAAAHHTTVHDVTSSYANAAYDAAAAAHDAYEVAAASYDAARKIYDVFKSAHDAGEAVDVGKAVNNAAEIVYELKIANDAALSNYKAAKATYKKAAKKEQP
jgi:hypothetical protein